MKRVIRSLVSSTGYRVMAASDVREALYAAGQDACVLERVASRVAAVRRHALQEAHVHVLAVDVAALVCAHRAIDEDESTLVCPPPVLVGAHDDHHVDVRVRPRISMRDRSAQQQRQGALVRLEGSHDVADRVRMVGGQVEPTDLQGGLRVVAGHGPATVSQPRCTRCYRRDHPSRHPGGRRSAHRRAGQARARRGHRATRRRHAHGRARRLELNGNDEYMLERALKLTEAHGGEVSLLAMAPAAGVDALRKGLAIGATRAYHVVDDASRGLGHPGDRGGAVRGAPARSVPTWCSWVPARPMARAPWSARPSRRACACRISAMRRTSRWWEIAGTPVVRARRPHGQRPRGGPGGLAGGGHGHPAPGRAAISVPARHHGRADPRDRSPGTSRTWASSRRRSAGRRAATRVIDAATPPERGTATVVTTPPDQAAATVVDFLASRGLI